MSVSQSFIQSVMSDDAATRPRSPNLRLKAQNKGRLRWAAPPGHPQVEVLSTSNLARVNICQYGAGQSPAPRRAVFYIADSRRPLPSIRGMESVCPDRYIYPVNSAAIGLFENRRARRGRAGPMARGAQPMSLLCRVTYRTDPLSPSPVAAACPRGSRLGLPVLSLSAESSTCQRPARALAFGR